MKCKMVILPAVWTVRHFSPTIITKRHEESGTRRICCGRKKAGQRWFPLEKECKFQSGMKSGGCRDIEEEVSICYGEERPCGAIYQVIITGERRILESSDSV